MRGSRLRRRGRGRGGPSRERPRCPSLAWVFFLKARLLKHAVLLSEAGAAREARGREFAHRHAAAERLDAARLDAPIIPESLFQKEASLWSNTTAKKSSASARALSREKLRRPAAPRARREMLHMTRFDFFSHGVGGCFLGARARGARAVP